MYIRANKNIDSGGGVDTRFTVSGTTTGWAANSQKIIDTGLSSVKYFYFVGINSDNTVTNIINYDNTLPTGKQIAVSCGTTIAISSTNAGQTGNGDGIMSSAYVTFPKIVAINGGSLTINNSSAAGKAVATGYWWAG